MAHSETLIRFWYCRLPRVLDPIAPRLASAVGDGLWTTVWLRASAWAPVLVFLIGLLVPRTWPGTLVYTESPFFLGLAAALSIVSGTLGVGLLAGNGLREALSHDMASGLSAVVHVGAARLVVWLLLAVFVVALPQLAHLVTEAGVVRMRFLRDRDGRAAIRSVLLALVYPCLVLAWCQAMTVLVLPVFTWSGGSPSVDAVWSSQVWWMWLASAAACAAGIRGILEGIVAPRMSRAIEVAELERARDGSPREAGIIWRRAPVPIRIVLAVIGMTSLLGGMFARVTDALVAGIAIGVLAMLGHGVCEWLMGDWADRMRRIPGALRVTVALGLGYVVAFQALELTWGPGVLRSIMIGTLFTLTMFVALFPRTHPQPVDAARSVRR